MARKLERAGWRPFLDRVSKGIAGKQAEIEVASLDLGDQLEAEWVPLIGLVYDPKDDIVEVAVEGLDHLIHKPRELYVEEEGGELLSLEVIDEDGTRSIIKLKDMLMLPVA
jgi:Family of unknown function (DUF5335)